MFDCAVEAFGCGGEGAIVNKPRGANQAVVRVFIVDDHPLVRQGLKQLIGLEPDMEVCGEAESGPEAIRRVAEVRPSVVTVDISLRDSNGLDLVKGLHDLIPGLPIVVLSMHDEAYYAERVLRSGASAYVMKDEPPETIVMAVRMALAGELRVSPRMSARLLSKVVGRVGREAAPAVDGLSDRELEVLDLIGRGHGTRKIAGTLHISVKTVEAHRENIKRKLMLSDANDLVQYAVRWVLQGHPA
jgi:DNA-binding NarL/FixJ family response regulator